MKQTRSSLLRLAIALFLVIFCTFGLSTLIFKDSRQEAAKRQFSGSAATAHRAPHASKPQELFAGFWRVDSGFESLLRIKNVLITRELQVTPVIFLADGTEYPLLTVTLAPGGISDISVNEALDAAPSSLRTHLSNEGSLILRFLAPSVANAAASLQVLNVSQSLVFASSSQQILTGLVMPAGEQRLDSIWWKRDPGVSVFAVASNISAASRELRIEVIGSQGSVRGLNVTLPPKGTERIDVESLVRDLPEGESGAGGVSIKFAGNMGDIFARTELVNAAEGYSATSEFQMLHRMSAATVSMVHFGSVGIMVGSPDPGLHFPSGTRLSPYAALRNRSDELLVVQPQLFLMEDNQVRKIALPEERLEPGKAVQLSLASALSNFNGIATLTFSYEGHMGDLQVATGSVDQTGTYVFEVMPNGLDASWSKSAAFWSVAGEFDSMLSVFNAKGVAQDIVVRLTYSAAGGLGSYTVPLHLQAGETRMVDVKELITRQEPDAAGKVIPREVEEGSAQFQSAQGAAEEMELGVSSAIFNVQTATCSGQCPICTSTTSADILPGPLDTVVGGTGQASFMLTLSDGSTVDMTAKANWSSNNTAVATVQSQGSGSPGLVSGLAVGNIVLRAEGFAGPLGEPMNTCPSSCPIALVSASGPANITPVITSISPTFLNAGDTKKGITINGLGFGSSPTVNLPSGITRDSTNQQTANNTQIQLSAVSVAASASIGTNSITVTANGQTSAAAPFTIDGPDHAIVVSDVLGKCSGCTTAVKRAVTLQVIKFSGSPVFVIPIGETPSNSGWNCTQAFPGIITTPCAEGLDTDTNGMFVDSWTIAADTYGPTGCGFNFTTHWQWCSAPKTFATLSGYIRTNAISMNGVVSPPNQFAANTPIFP